MNKVHDIMFIICGVLEAFLKWLELSWGGFLSSTITRTRKGELLLKVSQNLEELWWTSLNNSMFLPHEVSSDHQGWLEESLLEEVWTFFGLKKWFVACFSTLFFTSDNCHNNEHNVDNNNADNIEGKDDNYKKEEEEHHVQNPKGQIHSSNDSGCMDAGSMEHNTHTISADMNTGTVVGPHIAMVVVAELVTYNRKKLFIGPGNLKNALNPWSPGGSFMVQEMATTTPTPIF